ncbi:MAG: UDP-glucose 4-epimerase, partial [Candidatus Electrothrix sp. LOE2]|nr:UDP-glucose 4-epimerase [Candidatus Electrothrix sp. LOE2]
YTHARQGDTFVQKAPAATVGDLAQAVKELFQADNQIKIIGTRHGEKLYETLLTREEMNHAEDLGGYYRIPADDRDLNYNKYFIEGQETVSASEDYHSHNTERLTVEQIKEKLLSLQLVQDELTEWQEGR